MAVECVATYVLQIFFNDSYCDIISQGPDEGLKKKLL